MPRAELGPLATQPSLRARDGDPLPCPGTGQVGFKFGDHAECGEQQSADRVGRVVHRAADVEPYATGSELVDDVARVRDRASKSIQFRDEERVAAAARRKGFAQPRLGSVRAR